MSGCHRGAGALVRSPAGRAFARGRSASFGSVSLLRVKRIQQGRELFGVAGWQGLWTTRQLPGRSSREHDDM